MLSSSRDNWERLVATVVKRQQIWELCHQPSRSPSICSTRTSDDFSEQILSFSSSNFEPFSVPPSPLHHPRINQFHKYVDAIFCLVSKKEIEDGPP
ncbi:hypothetical protein ACS0TY_027325 [Phlomoides rotata]